MERTDAPAGMPPLSEAAAAPHAWRGTALCAGVVMGALAQLQQPQLWALAAYGGLGLCGLLWCMVQLAGRRGGRASWFWALLAAAGLAFAATGLRALQQQAQQLGADLQGKDLRIVGTLAAMPQPTSNGVRL
ncbi:MAG: competence protein ComEC, partial [Comamonas sp.]|nr:competence protein ComEC [Comamonas sp.]